jgi:hypothetical protein
MRAEFHPRQQAHVDRDLVDGSGRQIRADRRALGSFLNNYGSWDGVPMADAHICLDLPGQSCPRRRL